MNAESTKNNLIADTADVAVVGAGHAGIEASLACARMGLKTILFTLSLDQIANLPCNPSIGGTGKGHLVFEIDALGGEMGKAIDETMIQIKMLNRGKGAAVQSLRAQADKFVYHTRMKKVLENTDNLYLLQCEATEVLTEDGKVIGVNTDIGATLLCKAVVIATGVYLNSKIIAGPWEKNAGPSGFVAANALTANLIDLGFKIRRFKTGTPARIDAKTIDFSKFTLQDGDTENVYPFSFMTERLPEKQYPCYLGYTNKETHKIIMDNLDRSPLYNGAILSTGPRYCPSIETKVVRFADKDKHQIFLEPEGLNTNEIYVQGMSTSMPHDVQLKMYRSIEGLENCRIMRYAYAIEYDCIDSLDLYPTLEYKKIKGLFTAGQINGTSGYEEAGVQGLLAGLNASLQMQGKEQIILRRDQAYAGVLIDDLVTKGTEEPYRIMTSRAEHRIMLRQDNADLRLTPIGRTAGLVDDERWEVYLKRRSIYEKAREESSVKRSPKICQEFITAHGGDVLMGGISYDDMVKRNISLYEIKEYFGAFKDVPCDILETVETDAKYQGYIKLEQEQIERAKNLEEKLLPPDIDYSTIHGLRMEARQKLNEIRPLNLGQAGRISGVNPADIAVLMVYLRK